MITKFYRNYEVRFELFEGSPNKLLKLSVLDETSSKPELIGDTVIPLDKVYQSSVEEGYDEWHELSYRGKYAGEVYLEMTFYPTPSTLRKFKKMGLTRGSSTNSSNSLSASNRSCSEESQLGMSQSQFGNSFSRSYSDASDSLRYSLSSSILGLSTSSRPLPSEPNCNKNVGVSKTTDNIDTKLSSSVQQLHNPNVPPALSPPGGSLSYQNSLHSQSQPNLLHIQDQPPVPMHTSLHEASSLFNMSMLNHSLPNIPSANSHNEPADFAKGFLDLPTIPPEAPQHRVSSSGTVINRPRAMTVNPLSNDEGIDDEAENFFNKPLSEIANEHPLVLQQQQHSEAGPDVLGNSQHVPSHLSLSTSSNATVIHNVYSSQPHAYSPVRPSPLSQSTSSDTSVETLQYQTHPSSQPPITPPVHRTPRSSIGTVGETDQDYEFGSTVIHNKPRHSIDNSNPATPFSQFMSQGNLPTPPPQQQASDYNFTDNAGDNMSVNGRTKRSIKRKPIKAGGAVSTSKQSLANVILPYPDATYSVSGQTSDSDEDLKEIPFSPDSYISNKGPAVNNNSTEASPTKQKTNNNNNRLFKPMTQKKISSKPDLSVQADTSYMVQGQWDISNELNSGYSDEVYDEVTGGYKHHHSHSDVSSSDNSSFPVTPSGSPVKTQALSSFDLVSSHSGSVRGDAYRPSSKYDGYGEDDYYDDGYYNDDLIMEGFQKSNDEIALNLPKISTRYQ